MTATAERREAAKHFTESITSSTKETVKQLGLPPLFVAEIARDQGWVFALKMHGLIDAALEHSVYTNCFTHSDRVIDKSLRKFCSNLNYDGRISKLALAETYQLLDAASARNARAFGRLRNAYAHDVRLATSSVTEIVQREDDAERFLHDLTVHMEGHARPGASDTTIRLVMLASGCATLARISAGGKVKPERFAAWASELEEKNKSKKTPQPKG